MNAVRAAMLKSMVNSKTDAILKNAKVDLSRMPPCLSSLRPHILRVNYRVAQWKRSHETHPSIPSATEHGWRMSEDSGILEQVWCDGEIVPQRLIDLLADHESRENETPEEGLSDSDSDTGSDYDPDELSDDADSDELTVS